MENMKLKDYFEQFLEYKRKEGCTNHTIGEYKRFLFGALSHCLLTEKKINDLRLVDVASVIESGRKHGSNGPTRGVVVFRQLLKFLEDSGVALPFNWTKIKVPMPPIHEQDFLTEKEFEDFVGRIPIDTFYGLRDKALYEFLWSTGCRIGEALALKREDIDLENREVKIQTLKGGDEGKVYLSDRCVEWLKRYLGQRLDNHPALWVLYNQGVRPLSHNQAKKNLLDYRKKFGIKKKLTHHCFRRSFCSLLLEKGATIKEVAILARHRSERTTLRFYCKIEKQKAKKVHQMIFNGCK